MADKKKHVSVVVIGHVDSGKSTTTGHLIFLSGGVDKRVMEKLEKEAIDRGKGSFKYAYLLDKTNRERESGITIDITQTLIKTKNTLVTIVDAPGHRDFLKNMITGASVADMAILVLPAAANEYEVAIGKSGSAREHAMLAFTMGVKTIVILINKMDVINYNEARYNECVKEARLMCKKIGYAPECVAAIPVSGLVGDNLHEPSPNMPWFKGWSYVATIPGTKDKTTITGHTMLDWCDTLLEPARPFDKPLRMVSDSVFKIEGVGTVAAGRIETGQMRPGNIVFACPESYTTEVKSIEMHHVSLPVANPGENIGFNAKGISVADVHRGTVFGLVSNDPPRPCVSFEAHTIIVDSAGNKDKGFKKGFSPSCDAHCAHFQSKVVEVLTRVDRRTGNVLQEHSPNEYIALKCNEAGLVRFKPEKPVCLEVFSEYNGLGRLAIREARKTIAVSVIKDIEKQDIEIGKAGGAKGGKKAGGKGAAGKAGATKGGK